MTLRPVLETSTPQYPPRSWNRATWLKRAVGVVALSLALGLGACGGDSRGSDDDWDDTRYAGGEPAPSFWCGEEEPEWMNTLSIPGTHEGYLCGEQTAWASVDIADAGVYAISLVSGQDDASVGVLDPTGVQVAQLDGDMPLVNIELSAGRWVFAVDATDPILHGWSYFELSIQQL